MKTLRRGNHFRLTLTSGQFWIKLLDKKSGMPSARRVSRVDARYLIGCGKSFDDACVLDFGCGVFAR